MKRFQFTCDFSLLHAHALRAQVCQVQQLFLNTHKSSLYSNGYGIINMPFDGKHQGLVTSMVWQKKALNIKMLIVIGIGGSNLGARAVHEFLHGVYYNDKNPEIFCYFVDTLDADKIHQIISCMESSLMEGNNVLLNVISKSGTTTETIINFNVFLTILKRYKPEDYHSYIVVTSDTDSALSKIAKQEHFSLLETPHAIGGRFSIFTAVGLFPLAFLGVDITALCLGAQEIIQDTISKIDTSASDAACISYDQCMQGNNIHDMFVFGSELQAFGLWYRQLVGESLGKNARNGITPTVSVGSTDLHSVGQLYLGGPYDKYVTFVSVTQKKDCIFDIQPELLHCMPVLKKNSMEFVMNAIIQGTQKAYILDNRPFESVHIIQKDAESIGQMLQWYMLRVVHMAHLFEVNPFDQPHVELYKNETRKIVSV